MASKAAFRRRPFCQKAEGFAKPCGSRSSPSVHGRGRSPVANEMYVHRAPSTCLKELPAGPRTVTVPHQGTIPPCQPVT